MKSKLTIRAARTATFIGWATLGIALLLALPPARAEAPEPWWEQELELAREQLEESDEASATQFARQPLVDFTKALIDLLRRTRGDVEAVETISDDAIFLIGPLRKVDEDALAEEFIAAFQDHAQGSAELAELAVLFDTFRIKPLLRHAQWNAALKLLDGIGARISDNPDQYALLADEEWTDFSELRSQIVDAARGQGKSLLIRDSRPAENWIVGREAGSFRCGMGAVTEALADQMPAVIDVYLGRGDMDSAIASLLDEKWEASLSGEGQVEELADLLRSRYDGARLAQAFAAAKASIARLNTPTGVVVRIELLGHELRMPTHRRAADGSETEIVVQQDWLTLLHESTLYRELFPAPSTDAADPALE